MDEIIVKSQEDYNAIPDRASQTIIKIVQGSIEVRHIPKNCYVTAYGSATVKAYGSATVKAYHSVTVTAFGSATVKAYHSVTVKAYHSVTVKAYNSATVTACNSATVEAYGSATVKAYGLATVKAYHSSIIIIENQTVAVQTHDTSICVNRTPWRHTLDSFTRDTEKDEKGRIILFKSVRPENHKDFWTNSIEYKGIVTCPDWDPDTERECGGGLHVSPSPEEALHYNEGTILKVAVEKEDIVVYPHSVSKVRCRKLEVLGEI